MQLDFTNYSKVMRWLWDNNEDPEHPAYGMFQRYVDSIAPTQIECKKWLVEELGKVIIPCEDGEDGNYNFKIEIIGGWFGFPLVDLLYQTWGDHIREIVIYEMDPGCKRVINAYLAAFGPENLPPVSVKRWDYFTYRHPRRAHVVINTSCEHMKDMVEMKECYIKPERTLLVLQSNDKRDEDDHINCVDSCQELAKKAGIKELNGGVKTFRSIGKDGQPIHWNRFMVMGKWYD